MWMLNNYTFLNHNVYYLALYFIIFSFMGWIMETSRCSYAEKKFINRGFLNGPICPIYGTGMVIIIICIDGLKDNIFALFFGGLILASVLEYVVAALLEGLFKAKWWDYSTKKFNIKGRVALSISLCWGGLCVVMMKWVVPFLTEIISKLDPVKTNIVIYMFVAVVAVDTFITAYSLISLRKILAELSTIGGEIKEQFIKTQFYTKTEEFMEKYGNLKTDFRNKIESLASAELDMSVIMEKWREVKDAVTDEIYNDQRISEFIKSLNEKKTKYLNKIDTHTFVQRRILDAFPNFKPFENMESFKALKKRIGIKRKENKKENNDIKKD